MTAHKPNPGSDEARALGCRCAVLDNNHGLSAPWPPDGWWISGDCPLHAPFGLGDQVEVFDGAGGLGHFEGEIIGFHTPEEPSESDPALAKIRGRNPSWPDEHTVERNYTLDSIRRKE